MRYRNSECCITPEEIAQTEAMPNCNWNARDGWNMREKNCDKDDDNWYRRNRRDDNWKDNDKCDDMFKDKDKCDNKWDDKDKCDYDNNCSEDIKRRLSELQFAAIDLNLFLDTHPCDKEALEMFKKITKTIESVKMDYVRKYGPLKAGDSAHDVPFQWASGEFKWPWEK